MFKQARPTRHSKPVHSEFKLTRFHCNPSFSPWFCNSISNRGMRYKMGCLDPENPMGADKSLTLTLILAIKKAQRFTMDDGTTDSWSNT